jgi:hypothetical protein
MVGDTRRLANYSQTAKLNSERPYYSVIDEVAIRYVYKVTLVAKT